MTTVAYKDGVMVSDRQLTRGDEAARGGSKIFRTQEFLVGMSGAMVSVLPFKSFLYEHENAVGTPEGLWEFWEELPDFGEWDAIIVDRRGIIYSSCDGPPIRLDAKFETIGSGASYAMGAMACGVSAERAVVIASEYDIGSGGGIEAVYLDETVRSIANG
jgi:hypothetical protein